MTDQQRALILFIKSALTQKAYPLPEAFDLGKVFQIARAHGVDVLAYYGALQCGVDKDTEAMAQEFPRVCQSIAISETQMAQVRRISEAFEAQGIRHMLLKGTRLKKRYPHGEMRRMGDADILIDVAQYEAVRGIMQGFGYTEKYESDHELVWEKKPVVIEFHKRLIPSYNKDYYRYYGDGWKLAILSKGHSYRYKMAPCDEMIYLFTHFAKHYRDAGIGIRHLVDLWVYRQHNPDMDDGYILQELQKLQLLEFYGNIRRTLALWFEDGPSDDKAEFITQFIFTSGEYGRSDNSRLSTALKSTKGGRSPLAVKIRRVLQALFPGYAIMCKLYPVLEKRPVLLPVMWLVRLISKLFHRERIRQFTDRHLRFTAEEISAYQRSLNYVGLDFHFTE